MKQTCISLFLALVIMWAGGCTKTKRAQDGTTASPYANGESATDTMVYPEPQMEFATTAFDLRPLTAFPAGFWLDTLRERDTALHFTADYFFPSPANQEFDPLPKILRDSMHGAMAWYSPYPSDHVISASYEAWITSFFLTDSILSMCFTEQGYSEGAANYNQGFFTLNWNREKNRLYNLTELLSLPDDSSKARFCRLYNEHNEFYYGTRGLEPRNLNARQDFFLRDGELVFCFDEHVKGPFVDESSIPLSKITAYLR